MLDRLYLLLYNADDNKVTSISIENLSSIDSSAVSSEVQDNASQVAVSVFSMYPFVSKHDISKLGRLVIVTTRIFTYFIG